MSEAKSKSEKLYESNPFQVAATSFSKVKKNWELLLTNIAVGAGGFFTVFIVFMLAMVAIGAFSDPSAFNEEDPVVVLTVIIVLLTIGVLTLPLWTTLAYAGLKYFIATSRGVKIQIGSTYKEGFKRGFGLLGLNLLMTLAVLGGLLLFIVPGILIGLWFAFAPYIYVDQKKGIFESFSASRQLIKGKYTDLIGAQSMIGLINVIVQMPSNLIPYLIILTWPFEIIAGWLGSIVIAYRYTSAADLAKAQLKRPPTHWGNWLAIGLFILFWIVLVLVIIFALLAVGLEELNK